MRLSPRTLALLVALWGAATSWLGREAPTGCPLGSCPACGACLRPPTRVEEVGEVRVG